MPMPHPVVSSARGLLLFGAFTLACGEPEPVALEDMPMHAAPGDTTAPTFPADAPLIATAPGRLDGTPRAVVLRWRAATDDHEVVTYLVRVDGEEIARLNAPAVETILEGVAFDRARTFSLVAVDAAANESAPITAEDALAPWFPEGAALGGRLDGDHVTLTWPAAEDDGGVVAYSIQNGEDELASVEADTREQRIHLDDPARPVSALSVVARDESGKETRLSAGDELAETLARLSVERAQAQVEQMLLGALADEGRAEDVLPGHLDGNADDILAEAEGVGVATGAEPSGALGPLGPRIRGRVTVGDPSATGPGTLDRGAVVRLLRSRQRAMQVCYERVLRRAPTAAGRVVARFTVLEVGRVADATALEDTTGSEDARRCVIDIVRRFWFEPGPVGGSVTYTVPVTLAPQS